MKKIAVSVLCRCCRNRKYLREGRCLKCQRPNEICSAFVPERKNGEDPDLIAWAEREMEK